LQRIHKLTIGGVQATSICVVKRQCSSDVLAPASRIAKAVTSEPLLASAASDAGATSDSAKAVSSAVANSSTCRPRDIRYGLMIEAVVLICVTACQRKDVDTTPACLRCHNVTVFNFLRICLIGGMTTARLSLTRLHELLC